MGTFHTVCAFLTAIGKRFSGAGLKDVQRLIESGIVATGSVSDVLQGEHYNRAIRTHKVNIFVILFTDKTNIFAVVTQDVRT